jgi:D-beta-D-heptose 7-phosphate kinase/D-beta-D-heptose 1-phosphate adenosyltransferase
MLEAKIKNLGQLSKIIARLKAEGEKIVFTNGCFDLLHYGHVRYLEDSKKKGDILVVAVNSDASVRRLKGNKRPIMPQKDRLRIIAGLGSVDYVVMFKQDTPFKIIKTLRPDVIVKGADWGIRKIVGADFVAGQGGKAITIKLVRGRSTTNLIKKIAGKT